ncbi:Mitochondrial RNA-splicing protein MRS3 [Picochlorum sp. SENEW3]|nr:Mitochondrial RNA-splicing protein MRS3 [Picochlorum sp. SENEW3]
MVILTPKYPRIHEFNGKRRNALRIGGVACVALAGTAGLLSVQQQRSSKKVGGSGRMTLNETAIDCISGALGEVAALYSLFPLDTLKVQCQAKSVSLSTALKHIVQQGPRTAVRLLYAGAGTAAFGGTIVGALHLSVYYYWKRIGDKIQAQESSSDGMSKGGFALFGALMSSICVGAVEAPFDQVKMRAQANAIRGPPMKHLIETLTSSGARAVMSTSFVPFIMKAIPHDVGELITFSALSETDSIAEALGPFPESARDAVLGAAAAVTAAVLSTPFDVVCTKTNVSGAARAHGTMFDSLKSFGKTARTEFQKGGVRAFYSGFLPRLLQMVPAGVIYWAVVESSRRALSPKPVTIS